MTQRERDRLVVLRKVEKGHISQKQGAQEIGVTPRQVRRMLKALAKKGDKAVIHGLKGRESALKVDPRRRREMITILSDEKYLGFGPTLASEYLSNKHKIQIGREALRQIMIAAKLWRPKKHKTATIHQWRQRRSCRGELVQWDTSEHDWLEGRGPKLYLIHMIDDATSRLTARFVEHDSTEANLQLLWAYLERHGRPAAFYTDKASLFRTAPKIPRDQKTLPRDEREVMPPTQIGRALQELSIAWQAAHSPQAKGRVERSFGTAQDRLVKGLRIAAATTLEQANEFLEREFLPWWNRTLTVTPANTTDAHRPLDKQHRLEAILSLVDSRHVSNDYTVQFGKRRLQIQKDSIRAGLRGNSVEIERRLDGSLAMRFRGQYLSFVHCDDEQKRNAGLKTELAGEVKAPQTNQRKPKPPAPGEKMRAIMERLFDKPGLPAWKAGQTDRTRTRQRLD